MMSVPPPFHCSVDGLPVPSIMKRELFASALWALARKSVATTFAAVYLATAAMHGTAHAQQSVPIVRDAEIEALVRDYARPIWQAAGLSKSGVTIVLVNDRRFNAFVDGRRIFVNTGALMTAESPNEIIGVLAH